MKKNNKKKKYCPICAIVIIPKKKFKDKLSEQEFEISGICQCCQDKVFK